MREDVPHFHSWLPDVAKFATPRGDSNAVYEETDSKNFKINCNNFGPLDEECMTTSCSSGYGPVTDCAVIFRGGPIDIPCYSYLNDAKHLRRSHCNSVREKNTGRCTDHPAALNSTKDDTVYVDTSDSASGSDYRFAISIANNSQVLIYLNFVKGPTQVQFITLRRVCDMRREGLILSRGRRRYNFSQYRGTCDGKRQLNFALGAGAPFRGYTVGTRGACGESMR